MKISFFPDDFGFKPMTLWTMAANWQDVGGPDAPDVKEFMSYAAIVEAVAEDTNGIGYCSFDLMKKTGVKAVSIGGVVPSETTVNSGIYPYARLLRLYTVKKKPSPEAEDFMQFVQSKRGQEVLVHAGFVPHP